MINLSLDGEPLGSFRPDLPASTVWNYTSPLSPHFSHHIRYFAIRRRSVANKFLTQFSFLFYLCSNNKCQTTLSAAKKTYLCRCNAVAEGRSDSKQCRAMKVEKDKELKKKSLPSPEYKALIRFPPVAHSTFYKREAQAMIRIFLTKRRSRNLCSEKNLTASENSRVVTHLLCSLS